MPICILHFEDREYDRQFVQELFPADKFELFQVKTEVEFRAALSENWDAIISDTGLPSFSGFSALALARERCPNVPFIFFSSTLGEEAAVESLKRGATDYILKQRPTKLVEAVERAIEDSLTFQQAQKDPSNSRFRSVAFTNATPAGAGLDIAERENDEERIRQQAALLDQARDAIIVTDMEQRIVYWNSGARKLYGWSTAEALGEDANRLLFEDDTSIPAQALKSLISRRAWQGELLQKTQSGKEIVVESRWTLLLDDMEAPKSILVINTDVTEKKNLETQVLRTQRMESLGAIAGGIAHDLNNVLTPIVLAADMLRNETHAGKRQEMVENIALCAQRGTDMVRQILNFARGAGGERRAVAVEQVVKDIGRLISQTFPKSIILQICVDSELGAVTGNATQLHQVLMNLCVNARDAMGNGGTLIIRARNVHLQAGEQFGKTSAPAPGHYVCLEVSDTGTGISLEVQAKMFTPFFTTKEVGKGTGLGLSTVLGIVHQNGGFVEIETDIGKGTIFRVLLPAEAPARIDASVQTKKGQSIRGSGKRILLVDDEIAILEIAKLLLEARGFSVTASGSAVDGLARFREEKFEVVVTDLMMPDMGGVEFIDTLRQLDTEVKIIAASGFEGGEGTILAERRVTFLLKPYTTETLLQAIYGHD